ncbi:hypothetical protein CSV75_01685 [Sporosarcina sp. P18a]|uniref:hypothetical protein n=1 Tax=Sporosarcina sp. P18a TaxID=2048259 RepID=UPI000C163335|nr:hypothetical protein [Sporosarcina sp. P18a]PIC80529.1 hypothetical protein CSV75_01685 [Sporosarcina sp. P18a]
MTSKVISFTDDKGETACECGGKLVYQERWDKLFDSYDSTVPAFDMIYTRIYRDGQPKFVCDKCKLEVFVLPDYAMKK